jgi:hypothetical protein
MVNLHRLILTVALALTVAGFAAPAAAIKSDEALALCRQRGPDCKAMKVSAGDSVTVIICVNNSSSGNGVQCVQCATGQDCAVVRRVPETTRGGFVAGILTKNSQKR